MYQPIVPRIVRYPKPVKSIERTDIMSHKTVLDTQEATARETQKRLTNCYFGANPKEL